MDIEQLSGTKLGNYEIGSLLGRGDRVVVYKIRQADLDRLGISKPSPNHPDSSKNTIIQDQISPGSNNSISRLLGIE